MSRTLRKPTCGPVYGRLAENADGSYSVSLNDAGRAAVAEYMSRWPNTTNVLRAIPSGRRLYEHAVSVIGRDDVMSLCDKGIVVAHIQYDPARGTISDILYMRVFDAVYQVMKKPLAGDLRRLKARSMNVPITSGDGYREMGDLIADPRQEADDRRTEGGRLGRRLISLMASDLTIRESRILILRFGLQDGWPRTQPEVGSLLSIGPARVCQIETEAIRKLKTILEKEKLC